MAFTPPAPAPEPAAPPPELVAEPLAGRKARPVRWLVHRKIPVGKVSMFASVGGLGKSTLIRHLVACLTTGRPAFGLEYEPPPPCDVLLASVEDSPEDTILPHLLAEGADLSRVLIVEGTKGADQKVVPFGLRDVDSILAKVQARPGIRLLVMDPIMSYVAQAGASENSAAEVRAVLEPLFPLADRTGLSILLVAHLTKSTATAAVNRIVGSGAFRDLCRTAYAVGTDAEDPDRRILALVKDNVPGLDRTSLAFCLDPVEGDDLAQVLAAPEFADLSGEDRDLIADQLHRVRPLGRVDVDADTALGTGREHQAGSARRNCAVWLRDRLGTAYAWPDDEVARDAVEAGFTVRLYRRAKDALKPDLQVARIGFAGRWYVAMGAVRELPVRPDHLSKPAGQDGRPGNRGGQNGGPGQNGTNPGGSSGVDPDHPVHPDHSDQPDHDEPDIVGGPDLWPGGGIP